ncbi:MAG: ATP-binding protein [Planctomycetes bacterium]|nr:ATP-binding protein [Planctomycetota bacterium]
MFARTLQPVLRKAARRMPVVTLTGPRQSGKTTLARTAFPRHAYASLEDADQRSYALEDPRGFLGQFRGKVILDEVQRAPELLSYIQTIVDSEDVPGRFILTGSREFLLLAGISQSLAGRCAILHLLPFSLSELERRAPLQLRRLGRRLPAAGRSGAPDLMEVLFRGFYPRIHDKGLDPAHWLRDYFRTYVERDVRAIVNVGDLEALHRFTGLCAGRNGQLLNLSALASDCGVTHTTARRWLSVLEASFLVFLLRPHHQNFRKRLIRSPKLYFLDTGLLCYLLGIRSPAELHQHSSRGSIFASLVISELLKNYLHRGEEPRLFFWRDSTGHEVDVLIEEGRDLIPVEIKSGQTIASDFLSGLRRWLELAGRPKGPAALFYGGSRSLLLHGIPCCSWTCL